jgi:signal transduction histidine kinase
MPSHSPTLDDGHGPLTRALLNTLADLFFRLRKDGLILEFRAPRDHPFALSADGLVGRHVMELLPQPLGQLAMHYVEKSLRCGEPQVFSCQYVLPGKARIFEARLAVCGPGEVLAMLRDVTDRELLEKEIVESSHRTQMRLGQDLHDGLGQHLTGISFLSKALERTLSAQSLPEAAEAAEIGKLVLDALSQTRHLARGLFPVEVESSGLLPALRELAANVEERCQVPCSLECDEGFVMEDATISMHLFRLAQEAINNAVKHGKASRVVVTLRKNADHAVLSVCDNGIGFPADGAASKGLGLRIMNFRAQKIGGSLDIHPGRTGGSIVTCSFRLTPPGH